MPRRHSLSLAVPRRVSSQADAPLHLAAGRGEAAEAPVVVAVAPVPALPEDSQRVRARAARHYRKDAEAVAQMVQRRHAELQRMREITRIHAERNRQRIERRVMMRRMRRAAADPSIRPAGATLSPQPAVASCDVSSIRPLPEPPSAADSAAVDTQTDAPAPVHAASPAAPASAAAVAAAALCPEPPLWPTMQTSADGYPVPESLALQHAQQQRYAFGTVAGASGGEAAPSLLQLSQESLPWTWHNPLEQFLGSLNSDDAGVGGDPS